MSLKLTNSKGIKAEEFGWLILWKLHTSTVLAHHYHVNAAYLSNNICHRTVLYAPPSIYSAHFRQYLLFRVVVFFGFKSHLWICFCAQAFHFDYICSDLAFIRCNIRSFALPDSNKGDFGKGTETKKKEWLNFEPTRKCFIYCLQIIKFTRNKSSNLEQKLVCYISVADNNVYFFPGRSKYCIKKCSKR